MSDRGTGRTTRQMQGAPRGAVFVWCNGKTHYPQELAKTLGRDDLAVRPLSWLGRRSVLGQRFTGVVIDHAAEMDNEAREAYYYLRAHGVPLG